MNFDFGCKKLTELGRKCKFSTFFLKDLDLLLNLDIDCNFLIHPSIITVSSSLKNYILRLLLFT